MLCCNNLRNIACAAAFALCLNAGASVKPGVEVLRDGGFSCLVGKRVGLVTNPSGVDRELRSTVDIFHSAPEVNLVALFAPEHGIRGDVWAGDKVDSGKDAKTGLPVHSLYGATRMPTQEMLSGIDVMVYDIQDVGCRSYTFISTLGLVMRACSLKGIPVVVLDRPNPLGGLKVEGPYPEPGFFSFVGQYRIPYIYGLTVGELAMLINEEGLNCGQKGDEPALKCELSVIPMEGWTRNMLYKDTGLPWIAPSPNIPTPEAAMNYPASGICGEFYGYLQIGIGYTLPFSVFAAEWIDADELKARLDSYALPGVAWRPVHYRPFSGSCAGRTVHGVQFHYTDYEAACISMLQFYVIQAVNELYGREPFANAGGRMPMIRKVCGSDTLPSTFAASLKVSSIAGRWNRDTKKFREISRNYYLYE